MRVAPQFPFFFLQNTTYYTIQGETSRYVLFYESVFRKNYDIAERQTTSVCKTSIYDSICTKNIDDIIKFMCLCNDIKI